MSARDDEDRFVPIDPQEYLSFLENFEAVRGENVSKETQMLLMYVITEAIARADTEAVEEPSFSKWFFHRTYTLAEELLRELPVEDPDDLRAKVCLLQKMTANWQEHFSRSQ